MLGIILHTQEKNWMILTKVSILEHLIFWFNKYRHFGNFLGFFWNFHLWSNKWYLKDLKSEWITSIYPNLHDKIVLYADCWEFTHNAMLQRFDLVCFSISFLFQRAKTLKLCTGPLIKITLIHGQMIWAIFSESLRKIWTLLPLFFFDYVKR